MNETQHIPSGYKPSPLGIIPEDWKVKRLGEVCTHFKSGITITSKDIHEEGLYPVYGGNGLRGYTNTFTHDGNYILIGRQGALCGNINYVDGKNYISEHAIAVQTDENMQWLKYKLENWNLNRFSESSAQPGLSVEKLVRYKLVIPTRLEQNKIADILSLWDTAIAKQTELVEKLSLRKRGLMQQLLTGKKRLKGFEGEWKEVRLGDVASINRGGSPRPIEDYITDGEGYNWIKIGDVGVDAKYITSTEEKIIKEGLSKTRFVKSGDFILSNSMSFGRPYILKIDGCIHDGWLVIQKYSQTFNIDFLYYILGYDTTLAQYKSMAAGSGVLNLNKEIVKEVQLRIPSIDEQIVIASILVNADKEIDIQKQKLAAMQAQKKGLMQVLLTGKKRINE